MRVDEAGTVFAKRQLARSKIKQRPHSDPLVGQQEELCLSIQLERNTDTNLELIRGDTLPKLTSKPEVAQRRRHPTQGTIEL